MLKPIWKRSADERNAHQLYGSIVTMTRMPALYTRIGVPDTLEKRFELLMLHMYLVLSWLNKLEGRHEKLKQELVDKFFEDTETVSRQVGVGDLSVPKKMRQLARMFETRMGAYQAASDKNGHQAMQSLLHENFFGNAPEHSGAAAALNDYVKRFESRLATQSMNSALENIEDIALAEGGGSA